MTMTKQPNLSMADVKAIVEVLIEGLRPIVEREARQIARDTLGEWKREHLSLGTPIEVRIPEPPPPPTPRRRTRARKAATKSRRK